jgi:flagellar biosynthesis/type III secretory pathway chaperone
MNDSLPQLVTALREELQQYGEMLALLDRQQELVIGRAAEELLNNVAAVNAQTSVIQLVRRERGERQNDVTRQFGLPDGASLSELIAALPEPHGLLVNALVMENNQCLLRVRRLVSQNHVLLTRSVDLTQRLLATLLAATEKTVYQGDGTIAPVAPARRLCDAVG